MICLPASYHSLSQSIMLQCAGARRCELSDGGRRGAMGGRRGLVSSDAGDPGIPPGKDCDADGERRGAAL